MPKLLFLARVAFICNVCFVLGLLLRFYPFLPQGMLSSNIIILGFLLGVVVNFSLHFMYAFLFVVRTVSWSFFPKWLMIVNFIFFMLQIIVMVL